MGTSIWVTFKFLQVPFLSSPHLYGVCLCQVLSSPGQVFKARFRKSALGRTYWNVETQRNDDMFCNLMQMQDGTYSNVNSHGQLANFFKEQVREADKER